MSKNRQPSLIQSIIPIIILIGLLAVNVLQVYGDEALDGANQLALLLAATVAGVIGIYNGFDFERIIEGVTKSIHSALPAIIILLLIGALAGTWLLSGVVPAMIYYGLDILNPKMLTISLGNGAKISREEINLFADLYAPIGSNEHYTALSKYLRQLRIYFERFNNQMPVEIRKELLKEYER